MNKSHSQQSDSEKLQFSGFISPTFSNVNSLTYQKPSEGIPLYSFNVDRRRLGIPSAASDWIGEKSESEFESKFESEFESKFESEFETEFESEFGSFGRTSIPNSGWRPRGVLVQHLEEHRSTVNEIAVSSDNSFFATASDDSTVKIWDSKKLEKEILLKSKLTYHVEGNRALCVAIVQNSSQVVVGSCNGFIHMFSVDNYSGNELKCNTKEGAVINLLNCHVDNHSIMYSTQNCGIHLWDIRSNSNNWSLKSNLDEGYILSLASGTCSNWFVSGSSRGVITLWDLRFLLPVNSWKYFHECPIEKICHFIPSINASLTSTTKPLVYVAAGCNEVSLWNAENGTCHQVLRTFNYEGDAEMSHTALAESSSKANSQSDERRKINRKYRVDELNEPPRHYRLPGIRTLLSLPGGDLLTGGTDLKIRRWDHYSPERSYCVCGPNLKGVGNDFFYKTESSSGVEVVQETKRHPFATKLTQKAILAAAATDSGGCHRDSIVSLASVKLNQRLLLSSGRDGAIKVWK
ncbi:serine/threonine-protein kinase VPS15-like [Cicer arietinum]|uniref:Serine/threonine-protein kinase VPS15-like n=1 Tax=Cicer arietinum TaxID=3827 RepID=A0A1S2Z0Y9_CICAR|nr:serine/threonine-protein kinase VPS15-like [Cicer arietinum]